MDSMVTNVENTVTDARLVEENLNESCWAECCVCQTREKFKEPINNVGVVTKNEDAAEDGFRKCFMPQIPRLFYSIQWDGRKYPFVIASKSV